MFGLYERLAGGVVRLKDSLFYILDNADPTKKVQFQVSGVTTGTTRTLTVPNASGTLALTSGTTAAAGTGATGATAPAFTGTAATAAEVDAFTGTGMTAVGQVMTSTDNQTMTLNQCAGMWLLTATGTPVLVVSNTAVTGAPAVLTVFGAALTDAGAYRILKAPTPVGSVASHTHTGPSHTHALA